LPVSFLNPVRIPSEIFSVVEPDWAWPDLLRSPETPLSSASPFEAPVVAVGLVVAEFTEGVGERSALRMRKGTGAVVGGASRRAAGLLGTYYWRVVGVRGGKG